MLPAFIAYQIGLADVSRGVAIRLANSITVSLLVSAGFITLFGVIGFIISIGGAFIINAFPWFGLAVGIALLSLGLYSIVTKKKISFLRASQFQGPRKVRNVREYYLFGISYGFASLSCTLPIDVSINSPLRNSSTPSSLFRTVSLNHSSGLNAIGPLETPLPIFAGLEGLHIH